jgi:hypothetical protein
MTPLIDGTTRTLELILGCVVVVAGVVVAAAVGSPVVALVCIGLAGVLVGRWRGLAVILLIGACLVAVVANDHNWEGEDQSALLALVVAVAFGVAAGVFGIGVLLRRALTRGRPPGPPPAPPAPPPPPARPLSPGGPS